MHADPTVAASLGRAATTPITVDITTTGRRSGQPRRIEIWMLQIGARFLIGGTPGPRSWLANLRADPALVLHLKDDVVADLHFDAREVTDPDDRREIWTHPSTAWYRTKSDLDALIADAPTVELTPRDPAASTEATV